ncbi:LuxR C-terminal-related transcriptional regulator [Methylobacterium nodulans]|uniref:LuxR C-terminal-related transcriptional regulator n=1 Tax=Methylobacterium nodulans TaxID=114616 RepID=UPI000A00DC82
MVHNLKQEKLSKALDQLSLRQMQIVGRMMQGKRIKEISAEIGLSERATKYHLKLFQDQIGITSQLQLVIRLLELRMSWTY